MRDDILTPGPDGERPTRRACVRPCRRAGACRLAMAAAPAIALLGCGRGDRGLPVSGSVAFEDARPVPAATIAFVPVGGGAAFVAPVVEGRFVTTAAGGPPPGEYDVVLAPPQPEIEDLAAAADPRAALRGPAIDPVFGRPGALRATVAPDALEHHFTVRPGPARR